MDRGFGINRYKLLSVVEINKVLYSTGNYIQYPVTHQNRKECEKKMRITESLLLYRKN